MYTYGDASNKIGTISQTWFGREKGELEVFDLCFWINVLAAECLLGQLLCEMCLTRDDDNNADCTSLPTAVGKCWKAILLHLTKGRKLVSIWHLQAEEKLWKLLTTTLQTASPIIMSFKKKLGSLASNKIWESSKRKYCEVRSGCLHFGRQSSINFLAWIKVVSPGDVICLQPYQRCRCQHPHPARLKDRLRFHEPLTTTWLSHVKKCPARLPKIRPGQLLCEMCLTRDDDNNADCTSLPTLQLENAEKRFCCTWPKDENSSAFDTCKQKKNCGNS